MANTPFLDLVKPAGTDHALVSVINSNSDKIDGGVSTLSEQIAKKIATNGTSARNLSTYTAKTLIDECVSNGNKIYYCSASGGNKLSDLPVTQAGTYIIYCDAYYKGLEFHGTNGIVYLFDYGNNSWKQLALYSREKYTENDITNVVSGVEIQTSNIIRMSDIVCCSIAFKATAQIGAYTTICKLPILPTSEINLTVVDIGGHTSALYLTASGDLRTRVNVPASNWIQGNFSFII